MSIAVREIAWAAGFLEGEGSFGVNSGCPRVSAGQVQKEPLERLQRMFGGHMWLKEPKSGFGSKPIWIWALNRGSAGVMMTLYTFMSPKRRGEIEASLDVWKKARRIRLAGEAICLRGHQITGDNAVKAPSRKYPVCRICKNLARRAWRKNKKA